MRALDMSVRSALVAFVFLLTFTALLVLAACAEDPAPPADTRTRVIANWDCVPLQRIAAARKIGVVAFHETGASVEFRVNGTGPTVVAAPTWNAESGVHEYWITLDPAAYPDGELRLSATARPGDAALGRERVLPDLVLYNAAGGTPPAPAARWADAATGSDTTGDGSAAQPYQSLEKAFVTAGSGGTVYLKAGTYTWRAGVAAGGDYDRWTTITRDPAAARGDVVVEPDASTSTNIFYQSFVKWTGITLRRLPDRRYMLYARASDLTWIDGCDLVSANSNPAAWFQGDAVNAQGSRLYMTDCRLTGFARPGGWWMRGCEIRDVGEDVWRASDDMFLVNNLVDNMRPNPGAHADLLQWFNPGELAENLIVYNLRVYNCTSQGLFEGDSRDNALVNVLIEKESTSPLTTQLTRHEHLLLWHCTFVNLGVLLIDASSFARCDFRNNVFTGFNMKDEDPARTELPGNTVSHNHVRALAWNQDNGPLGDWTTLGDPLFVSEVAPGSGWHAPGTYDYRLQAASPARTNGMPLACVPAGLDHVPYDAAHPARGCFGP